MDIISEKIVINDNYNGLIILNKDLEIIEKILFDEEVTIYSSYKNDINEELLLYCPDDNRFIFVDLKNFNYKYISINKDIEDMIFSDKYKWDISGIRIDTYCSNTISIDLENQSAIVLDKQKQKNAGSELTENESLTKDLNKIQVKLSEDKIEVFQKDNSEFIYPISSFIFLKTKILTYKECDFLIVLCGNKSNNNDFKILNYKID